MVRALMVDGHITCARKGGAKAPDPGYALGCWALSHAPMPSVDTAHIWIESFSASMHCVHWTAAVKACSST